MIILRKISTETASATNLVYVAGDLTGTKDGFNRTFLTEYNYQPDRITIYYNGQALHAPTDFYQTGSHYYIDTYGHQSGQQFAVMYQKQKVKGDYNITSKIMREDFSSPYAPAGLMLLNSLDFDEAMESGFVVLGAMSKRGYVFYSGAKTTLYDFPHQWAMDCPKSPCWFRLEKRDKQYTAYYSEDGENFVLINTATVDTANDEQYIGLFAGSASPNKRLVGFEYLEVEYV